MPSQFIQCLQPVFVLPTGAKVLPGSVLQFAAGGGTGTGYTFSITQNSTGGVVSPDGYWMAGPLVGIDQITVTDSAGNTASVNAQACNGKTLLQLRTEARQRADMVNDGNITDPELTSYVNASYAELYDLLIAAPDSTYFQAPPYFITTDGTNEQFPYPPDLYKLRGVDLQLFNTPNAFITLRRATFYDRNIYAIPTYRAVYGAITFRYLDMGTHFRLTPMPTSGRVLRVWYYPRPTLLVRDTDVVDGISGWEEYIVVDCAIKMLQKQESDASGYVLQKNNLVDRIKRMTAHKDIGAAPVAGDTMMDDYVGEYGPWSRGGMGSGRGW